MNFPEKHIHIPEFLRVQRLVVFTDLDGTLLDYRSYEPAREALYILRQHRVPLVPVTSKTVAEVQSFFSEYQLRMPFIAENGTIIAVPTDYFHPTVTTRLGTAEKSKDGYDIYNYGIPYAQVTAAFDNVRNELIESRVITSETLVAFHDMTPEQFAEMVGLNPERAQMALQRDAQLGYVVSAGNEEEIVAEVTRGMQAIIPGIKATQGGRFYQLGSTDKGDAAKRLMAVFTAYNPYTVFVGFGDSSGDVPFLQVCDYGYFVGKPTELPVGIYQVPLQGPDGIQYIVRQMLGGTV